MKFIIGLFLSLCVYIVSAQVDTTIYHVNLKTGESFYCTFNSFDEGNYMSIKKIDGSVRFIQWHELKDYKATTIAGSSTKLEELKKEEELKVKYSAWPKGIVINNKGDSTKYWIAAEQDYSYSANIFDGQGVRVANSKGEETKLIPADIREIIILEGSKDHYVNVGDKGLFKVITEGRCMLLQKIKNRQEGSWAMPVPTTSMGYYNNNSQRATIEEYYVYYMGSLNFAYLRKTLMQSEETNERFAAGFKQSARNIFAECPKTVDAILYGIFSYNTFPSIVADFNKCISGK